MNEHNPADEGRFALYNYDLGELATTKVFDSYLAATEAIDVRLTNIVAVRLPLADEFETTEAASPADDEESGDSCCAFSPSGYHVADPASAAVADGAGRNWGTDWLIDFTCSHCGRSGAIRIEPADIRWD
jgi:hypothetical protein